MKCKKCKYWDEYNDGKRGFCRRYAPFHIGAEISDEIFEDDYAIFPLTLKNDWCGEFVKK